ncbi:hypothetical protein BCD64_21750 [Nostoc sp. MBR 210]|nr:hypothetical protein BCD64_21750 [Nostoc sp. MBR 210]
MKKFLLSILLDSLNLCSLRKNSLLCRKYEVILVYIRLIKEMRVLAYISAPALLLCFQFVESKPEKTLRDADLVE